MTIQSTDTSRLLVVLLFAAVMTALLSQGDVDRHAHDRLQTSMQRISELDHRVNQELIRIRYGAPPSAKEGVSLLENSHLGQTETMNELLKLPGLQTEVESVCRRLAQMLEEKHQLSLGFIASHDRLQGEETTLAKKLSAILPKLGALGGAPGGGSVDLALSLGEKLAQLQWLATGHQRHPDAIRADDGHEYQNNLVTQLIKSTVSAPESLQKDLEDIVALAQNLFRQQDELDSALQRLLVLVPVPDISREAINQSKAWVGHQQNQANRNRYLLYFAAMVLLALLLFLLYQNRRVSRQWQRMTRAVESTADAIVLINPQGVIEYANPSFQPLTGWSPKEALGKRHRDLLTGLDDTNDQQLWQALHRGEEWRGTLLNHRWTGSTQHPGEPFWCQVTIAPIRNDQGTLEGAVVLHHDITELKQIQEQLQDASREAEEASRAKSEFLANMSHEIRTPMNAIIGLTKLCLRTQVSQKQRDYLTKIDTSSQSLLRIINDILDFSKIEAGRLEMEITPFRIDDVMFNVAAIVSLPVQDKGLELLFRLDPNIPRKLQGDSYRLEQVLINLVNNAVKFTSEGEVVVITELLSQTEEKVEVQFSVQDTGIGMTDEQMMKLFRTFSQVDASTTRRFGGTGLGLAICKRLVELMHGHIEVKSIPGQGSTFLFTAEFAITSAETRAQAYVPPRNIKGLRAMVIDDNAMARTILKQMLEGFGMEVITEKSGTTAVEALLAQGDTEHTVELVFVDWKMPGMNGLETIKRIRDAGLQQVPRIIMMTAFDDPKVREGAEEVRLDGFLTKPVSHSSLLDAIMVAFGEDSRHGQLRRSSTDTEALMEQFSNKFRGARILLVEDNEINQQVAQELLEGAGISVDWAENGQKAVIMVEKAHYDCILMDLQMPVLDGYGATEKIRSKDGFNRIPIIAMTANAMTGEREKCLAAGMNDYVSKPIDLQQLFTALVRWLDMADHKHIHMEIASPPPTMAPVVLEWDRPQIPDVDHRFGLNRVGGNLKLYTKLLVKFSESYRHCGQEVEKALARGEIEEAKRVVHTVKGLAGNIGCRSLQKASLALEQAMESGQQNALMERLRRFDRMTMNLADNIAQAMDTSARKEFGTDPTERRNDHPKVPVDLESCLDVLHRLEPGVKTGKPGLCKPVLEEMAAQAWPAELGEKIDEMVRQIKRYRYKDAYKLLTEIIQMLESGKSKNDP
ncbi:MAG: response regulator [Magnetococcales bacterium]|nr:response regulator [Magnetococcales bacterium]